MTQVQVIEKDGKPSFYVVPAEIWARVRELIEDAEDLADLERFDREDDGIRYPGAVAYAMADGVHPVRAWREYRGFTQQQLAAAAKVSKPFLSQIEGSKRAGSTATLRKLARALKVPVGAVLPL
ncbi:MAG: helix-turn-helix domain-containing protein [Betaproteobacteria bacterium]|jgi:DNA-binding XRE family transcriptional regulator